MIRNRAFLSAGGLFMLLVVMLGVVGIVNGLWSKNLVVEGVVTTGDLNADWDCGYTNDDGQNFVAPASGPCSTVADETGDDGRDPHGSFQFPYSSPFIEKDVAECAVEIDPDTDDPDFGAQVAKVTIENAYPSYECTITLYLSNTGSIPFNIAGSTLSDIANLPIELKDGVCGFDSVQVDPGEEEKLECTVHVLQDAEQNDCTGTTSDTPGWPVVDHTCTNSPLVTYEFDVEVCVAQWNETADFDTCKNSLQHEGPGTVIRVQSPALSFSSTGWGGWSCPAGTHVVGGGYEPGSATVAVSKAADPGDVTAPAYPTYPHYTYTPPETGWVVQNGGTPQILTVFALCAPN